MTQSTINLNADLGESFGAWRMGDDAALLPLIGSANIASGFHASDPVAMRDTVRLALASGVSLGAHPAVPDLQGFGRRAMQLSAKELEATILNQVGALQAIAAAEGGRVTHKPYGALCNIVCADAEVAATVARAVWALDRELILLAPALSALETAGLAAGLRVAHEVFADRTYQADGQLTPRSQPGAVLHSAQACVQHVLRMLDAQGIVTADGQHLPTRIDSTCVHEDGPDAVASAQQLRAALEAAGYQLVPLNALARTPGLGWVSSKPLTPTLSRWRERAPVTNAPAQPKEIRVQECNDLPHRARLGRDAGSHGSRAGRGAFCALWGFARQVGGLGRAPG